MQRFTTLVRAQPEMCELRELLTELLRSPALHARFVNTLSFMEYIGVRKMLKARRAADLDEEGLLHIIEEASHALRLKRAASQLCMDAPGTVATYSDDQTLAGAAGEDYMQGVDRGCAALVAKACGEDRPEANYLLSTAAIEIRAEAFYPLYEERLKHAAANFSVHSILKDELRHLAEMRVSLEREFPERWQDLVTEAVALESRFFRGWLSAMQAALHEASAPTS